MQKHIDPFLQQIGKKIRFLRKQRNLSQEEFADLANIDRTYIGGVERGERNITILIVKKIADALEVSVKDLFDDDQ